MPLAGFRHVDSCDILRPDSSQLTERERERYIMDALSLKQPCNYYTTTELNYCN
jgi:hypothetical protein